MPRKPAVEKKVAKEATVGPRERIARKAKSEASERMGGRLEPLTAIKASPTKVQTTPKKATGKKLKAAPTYQVMIQKAITENPSRKGTSTSAIAKYITANYEVKDNYRQYLRSSLARQVAAGVLVKRSTVRYSLVKKPAKKATKKTKTDGKKTTKKTTKKSDTEEKKTTKKKSTKKTDTEEKKTPRKTSKKTDSEKTKKASTRGKSAPKEKATTKRAVAKAPKKGRASNGEAETTKGTSETLVWVWQYFDNGFRNYDPAASDLVEGVYQEYLTSPYTCDVRAVKSGQWEYEIDFRIMTQRNVRHAAHTTRKIRRFQIPENEKTNTHKTYAGSVEDSN
eukprot:TRINITY_DN414_c0_g1_i1.p1 TRINITY_DN414_c0_g1~~TRINITY_DN414_c0_g1_i1.p1  ORF type:complete len:337 (-),score=98.68 TRINITY_DN414_c0_g1_i1:44-1054(-)